jgi:NAD(P)-dependent dehydrogenase (short-subunit alcohol dehydrogenase family)
VARRAIITGADSGIGKATAVLLAERGWDVGFTFHADPDGARGTVAEIEGHGRRAVSRPLDLTEPTAGPPVIEELAGELGGIQAFVNNAAVASGGPLLEFAFEEWRRTLTVNLDGAFLCLQAAARLMVAAGDGGRIVAVTSVHEHVPLRHAGGYCAAKGGLGMLVKVLALELAEHGIRVNAVAPGEVATPMSGAHDADPKTIERPAIPLEHRPAHAREIAAAIAFLVSDDSSYATGESLVIDGGLLLMAAVYNQDTARRPNAPI